MKRAVRKIKQRLRLDGLILVLILFLCFTVGGWGIAEARAISIIRMPIASGGGYIFYFSGFYSGEGGKAAGLFRARPDGSEEERLVSCYPTYILYEDGWVYYENGEDQFGNNPTVYKIRPDGSENTKVAKMGLWAIQNGVIFDASKDANGNKSIRRFAPGDQEPMMIHAADVAEMIADEEFLYITLNTYGGSCIYRMNHDGGQVEQLNTMPSQNLSLQDGYLYFQEYSFLGDTEWSVIKRMKTDGSQQEELFQTYQYFTQSDGYLYYSDDFLNVKRVPVSGGASEQVTRFRQNPLWLSESTSLLSCMEGRLYLASLRMSLPWVYMTLPASGGDAMVFGADHYNVTYYTDVPPEHPSYDAICYFTRAGVVSGKGDGLFDPDGVLTRAEFCQLFRKLNWYVDEWNPPVKFSDTNGHWAEHVIEWMQGSGLVSGYPDGTFRPDNPITVQEFIKAMVYAMGEDDGTLLYPNGYLQKARELSIRMDGISDFNAPATREQVISMLYSTIPRDGIKNE